MHKRLNSFYWYTRLWIWAATKSEDFPKFCFLLPSFIEIDARESYHNSGWFCVDITVFKPWRLYTLIPSSAIKQFCSEHELPLPIFFDNEVPF